MVSLSAEERVRFADWLVQEAQANQFPVQFPTQAEVADQAVRGARAADQVTIALALGGAGLVAGVAALGVALAGRRRRP